MKNTQINTANKLIYFVIPIFYLVGVGIHLNTYTFSMALKITEYFLFLMGAFILLINLMNNKGIKFILFFILAFLLTFSLEVLGVKTGVIFGGYYLYGDIFRLQLFNVPLVIGLNWVLLAISAASVSAMLFPKRIVISTIASGLLIVLLDYFLEPVAIKLGYWNWEGNSIPIMNYITWFLISLILTLLLHKWELLNCHRIMSVYYFTNLFYFIFLGIF